MHGKVECSAQQAGRQVSLPYYLLHYPVPFTGQGFFFFFFFEREILTQPLSRVKPKSLFAQASAKKLDGDTLFGSKVVSVAKENNA
jgi:hypothetical protein